eukprot:scaffold13404_cov17-Tisochrysis_lutea.AAC.1
MHSLSRKAVTCKPDATDLEEKATALATETLRAFVKEMRTFWTEAAHVSSKQNAKVHAGY